MPADLQDPELDKPGNGAGSIALAVAAIALIALSTYFFFAA